MATLSFALALLLSFALALIAKRVLSARRLQPIRLPSQRLLRRTRR